MRTVKWLWLSAWSIAVFFGVGAVSGACGTATGGLEATEDGGNDSSSEVSVGNYGPFASPSDHMAADAALAPDVFRGAGNGSCLALGSACTSAAECCSADCAHGMCSYPACTSDGQACTSGADCCSQSCVGQKCAPLNTACKTLGNACVSNGECCSSLCSGGTCQSSSFCGQPGDACSAGTDCCTGACAKANGQSLGTCATSPPSGPANCGLADGQLCGGTTATAGAMQSDAGLPACGGPCCSRACAPWGPTGVLVCQPVSGCHVVGDLCMQDSDCCGSAGLPGGSHKPVTCVISAPGAVGVCQNPMGCKPDGDVCKLKTSSCNASCDCCSGNCETEDTCRQDNVGVPRCAAAQCVAAGGACASSANCCNGAPCVPNPLAGGTPPYVCLGSQCVAACGQCTNTGDCCPGSSCVVPSGSMHGVCGPCGGGGGDAGAQSDGGGWAGGDGGAQGDAAGGGGSGGGGPASGCSLYGQVCQTAANCCSGVPCTGGRCQQPIY
jgi:hypothetical protein